VHFAIHRPRDIRSCSIVTATFPNAIGRIQLSPSEFPDEIREVHVGHRIRAHQSRRRVPLPALNSLVSFPSGRKSHNHLDLQPRPRRSHDGRAAIPPHGSLMPSQFFLPTKQFVVVPKLVTSVS